MQNKTVLFFGLLLIVLSGCAVYIAVRLRRHSMHRSDAERRSADALVEVQRLAKDLRSREVPAVDPAVPPGERLRKQYPGFKQGKASR
ncbi:MAG: hypothetical protein ACREON_12470 [Gemmatimonadaceae bacterium]